MPRRIRVRAGGVELIAELCEAPTAEALWDVLPVSGRAAKWGDELYFPVAGVLAELEADAREVMEIGEIGYWVQGESVAVFFGRTPASRAEEPRAVTPVNVVARILDDATVLRTLEDGVVVHLERA